MVKNIYDMNKNDLDVFIQKHLPTKKVEKDKYNEVFTSPVLINKMLDLFPQNVWSNHLLTWLDPSVGCGFFMIYVYIRLMNGLSNWEPNKQKRSTHIIKNMLYMVELNQNNCKICEVIFGDKLNLFCGDFLSDIKFKNYENLSFDCIIGNPPFNEYYGFTQTQKRINGGKNKLYEKFFLKSFEMLKYEGYISFVVPDNIFSGNGSTSYQIIINNNVPFVSFNPLNQYFFHKIQQPVCYFILQKINNCEKTIIENNEKIKFEIKLMDRPVNPIRNWTPYTEKLINKYVSTKRNSVIYNRGKSIKSYKGNKYTIIYSPYKTLQTNNIELARGIGIKKAIIFSVSPELLFEMDYLGKFGIGPNTFYIPFNTYLEGKKLEQFLNSEVYKTLAIATKTTRQYLKIAFIEHLKLTTIIGTKKHKLKTRNKTNKNKNK